MEVLRILGPLLLATLTVFAVERSTARRGLRPPGLQPGGAASWRARRVLASTGLGLALYLAVYQPLGAVGLDLDIDPTQVGRWQLFAVHAILAATLAAWGAAGFAGTSLPPSLSLGAVIRRQLGFHARQPWREVALGAAIGILAWMTVLGVLLLLAFVLTGLGASQLVPREAPEMVALLGSLPWWFRLAISLSAGLVEEAFFRGFLQPRAGVVASTGLFVLAHAGYQQPLMLLGVTLLSLCFAALSFWRQSVWAAVSAHATFDAIQLLVVVPTALRAAGAP